MLNPMRPDVINPPAIVHQAFDEEKALTECRTLIEKRDEAKGECRDAILALGQKLIEARRAMPGEMNTNGKEKYSPGFRAFIKKIDLSHGVVSTYMRYARNPDVLTAHRDRDRIKKLGAYHDRSKKLRRLTLAEVLAAYNNGHSPEAIFRAIAEELGQ